MLPIDSMPLKTKSTPLFLDIELQSIGRVDVRVKTKARFEEDELAAVRVRLLRFPSITKAELPESEYGRPISGNVRLAVFPARSVIVAVLIAKELVAA
jgi:hypothetical protein